MSGLYVLPIFHYSDSVFSDRFQSCDTYILYIYIYTSQKHCYEIGSLVHKFLRIFLVEMIYQLGVLPLIPFSCPGQFHHFNIVILYPICCNFCFHILILSFDHILHIIFIEEANIDFVLE